MNFKSVPLLAVAIAGTAMTLAACKAPSSTTQGATTSSAQAQTTEMPDASTPPDSGAKGSMRGDSLPPNFNLTDEQKTKLKQIQENYRSKMETLLTDEQKNKLKEAREQGTKPREAMASLNLTDAQKQQLKDLRQSQRQEIDNILTAEQKQQLEQMRQNWQKGSTHKDKSAPQG